MLRAQVASITALLLLATTPAVAAAAPEVPGFSFDPGEWAEQIAQAVTDRMGAAFNHFVENNLGALLWRFVLAVLGVIGNLLWGIVGALFGPANFITQIPEQWTVGLAPIQRFIERFTVVGLLIVGLMTVITTARLVVALGSFQPYGRWLRYYPRQAAAALLIVFANQIITWVLRFSNALSASMTDPTSGLAGIEQPSFDGLTAAGAMFIVFAIMVLRFAIRRAKVLVVTGLLIALTPLAVAAWCTPFDLAEEMSERWAGTLIGCILIQIPQAAALAIGAALIAAAFSSGEQGSGGGVANGVVAFTLGVGALAAAEGMPAMINRRLFRQSSIGLQPGMVYNALQAGVMLAGAGYAGPAAAPTAGAVVHAVAPKVAGAAAGGAAGTAARAVAPVAGLMGGAAQASAPLSGAAAPMTGGWTAASVASPGRAHIYQVVRTLGEGQAQKALPPPRG